MSEAVDINTGEIASTPLGVCPICKQSAFTDLVQALGELIEPGKGGKAQVGNRGTYTYLTLPDLLSAVRPALAAHHLGVMQEVTNTEGGVSVTTVLLHASGYAFRSPALHLRSGPGPQDIGSASTYGRRYTLAAMVGLAGAEDDDAHQASKAVTPPRTSTPPADPPSTPGGVDTRHPSSKPRASTPPAPPERLSEPAGGVDTTHGLPTDKQRRYMWTLISKTGWEQDEIRERVATHLHIPLDWHTNNLTRAQISSVIDMLAAQQQAPDGTE